MSLDRRLLAKVDRRLFSELDHRAGVQLVKVPVSDAVWSTWRRYCDAVGVPMGGGLAILLQHELASMIDVDLERMAEVLNRREAGVSVREAELTEWEADLRRRETAVAVGERRLANETAQVTGAVHQRPPSRAPANWGRNQPCWCGSDKKFKYCHGRTIQNG